MVYTESNCVIALNQIRVLKKGCRELLAGDLGYPTQLQISPKVGGHRGLIRAFSALPRWEILTIYECYHYK